MTSAAAALHAKRESAFAKIGGDRLRVLHVISGRMFGGGQRVVQDLVRTLPAVADLDVRLCLLGQRGDFFAEFGPTVVAYNGSYRNPVSAWRTARGLRRVLRAAGPDILHTHGFDAELIGALAVGRLPVRHISHVHDTPDWIASRRLKHRVRRLLMRLVLRQARTSWIACSEAVRQYVCTHLGWPLESVRTVRNGIDVERFSGERLGVTGVSPVATQSERTNSRALVGSPVGKALFPQRALASRQCDSDAADEPCTAQALVIGSVARLAGGKGIEHLLQAAALLAAEDTPFELRIAGDGPCEVEYRQLAVDLGIAPQVRFLGFVEDTPEFYRHLDVFVLASEREGLPLTVVEAMASGVPVVATRVGGVPEVIEHGVDGFLIAPKDIEGLRVGMTRLAQCPELRLTLGRNARKRVESEFGLERVAREIVDFYRNMPCHR